MISVIIIQKGHFECTKAVYCVDYVLFTIKGNTKNWEGKMAISANLSRQSELYKFSLLKDLQPKLDICVSFIHTRKIHIWCVC
jgi:hypothetical protein